MSDTTWSLEGKFVEFCNCEIACPCNGSAAPTHGHCNGVLALGIDKGHYGDTSLDGFTLVALYHFPGAMHDCDGHLHPILPAGTSDQEREAIFKILSGDGQPGGTIFDIFDCLIQHNHEPLYEPITLEWDIGSGASRIEVPGILKAATSGVAAPSETEASQRAAQGLMLNAGRLGAGSVESTADIAFSFTNCHASLAYFSYDQSGVRFSTQTAG